TASLGSRRFESTLDQPEALALLKQPGTLAVMPSLVDNSPMVIYECLEQGIPFLASNIGGGPELVVAEDRHRSFVEPTAAALERRLAYVLSSDEIYPPARAAFTRGGALSTWQAVIGTSPDRRENAAPQATVGAIVRRRGR